MKFVDYDLLRKNIIEARDQILKECKPFEAYGVMMWFCIFVDDHQSIAPRIKIKPSGITLICVDDLLRNIRESVCYDEVPYKTKLYFETTILANPVVYEFKEEGK